MMTSFDFPDFPQPTVYASTTYSSQTARVRQFQEAPKQSSKTNPH